MNIPLFAVCDIQPRPKSKDKKTSLKRMAHKYRLQLYIYIHISNQHSSKDGQHLSQTPPQVRLDVRFQWHDATHDPMLWHLCREHLSDSVDASEAGIEENSAWAGVTFTFYISSSIALKYQRSALLKVQHLPYFPHVQKENIKKQQQQQQHLHLVFPPIWICSKFLKYPNKPSNHAWSTWYEAYLPRP